MRRTIRSARLRLVWRVAILLSMIAAATSTIAAEPRDATFTQIINDVKLLPTGGMAKPAAMHDKVRDGSRVQTGMDSRTELTFTDQTLARLSANTIFNFNEGTRDLELAEGATLLQVPKGAGR